MADTLSGCGAVATDSITPTDPGLSPAERQRLTPQCARMLDLLRQRPRWNYELGNIGLSYTRRISDIRAAGYEINLIASNETGGRLYGLQVFKPMPDGSTAIAIICEDRYKDDIGPMAPESVLIDPHQAACNAWWGRL